MDRERQGRESWTGHAARTQRGRKQQQKKYTSKRIVNIRSIVGTIDGSAQRLCQEGGKTDSRLKDYGRGSEYHCRTEEIREGGVAPCG